jgi:hypothetical protein
MAHERDYENMHDIEELDDRELRDLVREQLSAHSALDVDDITVTVSDNRVTLSGRVGTEGERRIAEHVLTDVLGIVDFTNDLVVDQIRRAESPVDIDEHLADEERRAGTLLGEVAGPRSDEAAYAADGSQDDLGGTTDYQQAMGDGLTWNPPESPTPEGFSGSDAGPEEMGERH